MCFLNLFCQFFSFSLSCSSIQISALYKSSPKSLFSAKQTNQCVVFKSSNIDSIHF